jgi:high-affinity iron transporter
MGIKFIGEAMQEFQEQNFISFTEIKSLSWLQNIGLNPTLEALTAQILVILAALATFSIVQRNARLSRDEKAAIRSA